jgi:hypothetical protein
MDIINALVFSEINNNIPIDNKRYKNLLKAANITDSGEEARKKKLKELLSNTTIKRAYCLNLGKEKEQSDLYDSEKKAYKVNVKIPFTPNYKATDDEKKLGFRTVELYVPENLARKKNEGGMIENAFSCDSFYGAYCENMKYLLGIETGDDRISITNPELFNEYCECACFGDVPYEVEGVIANVGNVGGGIAPMCYIPNCSKGGKNYLDAVSRNTPQCSTVICQSVTQLGDISGTDSGVASFNQKINQECNKSTSSSRTDEKEGETSKNEKQENTQNSKQSDTKENISVEKGGDSKIKNIGFSSNTNIIGIISFVVLCLSCIFIVLALIMRR